MRTRAVSADPPITVTAPVWSDTLPGPHTAPQVNETAAQRSALPGNRQADVVIVGAGFTGLWTAYYLLRAQPDLSVVILEARSVGAGASGRNGGWCSALFPASWSKQIAANSPGEATRMQRVMFDTVDEVGRVAAEHGLEINWTKGGTITYVRTKAQLEHANAQIDQARQLGFSQDDYRWLSAREALDVGRVSDCLGAVYTPHCAAIQPLALVRGLAQIVESMGATIYEETPVTDLNVGVVRTPRASVRASFVIRATEAFTPELGAARRTHPLRRAIVPMYSLMVATAPLSEQSWNDIGFHTRPTFNDYRHLIIYGQRTSDGRLAFGGRGAPYLFGSRAHGGLGVGGPKSAAALHPRDAATFRVLQHTLRDLLPALGDVPFTHAWGGAVGIARDWWASVGLDERTGLGWAGGYVGDGVATSNLAGRTLADLLLEHDTDLVSLPWVGHVSPLWEPEPLRWLGVNGSLKAMSWADPEEARTGRTSRIAAGFNRLLG